MNKAKIEKVAREARAKSAAARPKTAPANAIAPYARQAAQERAAVQAVNLSPETIDAILRGLSRELRRVLMDVGPILARIGAADTIHTVERPPRVFGRALVEAQIARAVLAEAGVAE